MWNLLREVRFGARMLRKNPGFACAAVAVLALGIGANTAIFSLVNAFLLKPLLIQNPAEIVGCYSRDIHKPAYRAFSYPDFIELRENGTVFTSLLAHNMSMVGLAEGDRTRRVFADIISANYFTTFGVPLFQGRSFTPAEEQPGSAVPVAIVSYAHWKKTGADPQELGKMLRIKSVSLSDVDATAPSTNMQLALRCRYLPATVTNGSGGGTPAIGKMDPGDAAASFTALSNNTTKATTSGTVAILLEDGCNIYAGYSYPFPAPPVVGPSESFVFELITAPPSGVTLNQRSRAPVRWQSSCHGTMLEWCSISLMTISSPSLRRLALPIE